MFRLLFLGSFYTSNWIGNGIAMSALSVALTASLDQPAPPPEFTFLNETDKGRYILGHDKFFVSNDIHISNPFQRDITNQDDIYLGVCSVFLIAIFAEILHICILQFTRNSTPSSSTLVSSFLISEFAHFGNVIRHLAQLKRIIHRSQDDGKEVPPTCHGPKLSPLRLSLKLLLFTIILFIADFLSIFFTQQNKISSGLHEYNLRAYQPSAATLGLSRLISRLVTDRPCVSPIIVTDSSSKIRNYQLLTCVKRNFGGVMNKNRRDISENVTIESFFHRGGSDHMITYGTGFASVSVRAQVLLSNYDHRRLLFLTIDDDQFTSIKYIHRLTFHAAAEWLCRRHGAANEKWCSTQKIGEPQFTSSTSTREIRLWLDGKSNYVVENHTGLISIFENVSFPMSRKSFNIGVRYLVSSGFVQEEIGPSEYERVNNSEYETGIQGLLTETGRKLGVLALLIAVHVAFITMALLRNCLKPVSLLEIFLRDLDDANEQESSIGPKPRKSVHSVTDIYVRH